MWAWLLTAAMAFATPTLRFSAREPQFESATAEYAAIWQAEGQKITDTLERHTGLRLKGTIPVMVFEGVSHSGKGDQPMRLRASYPHNTKRSTLVHELGHRLLASIRVTPEIDEHRKLFLVLYDTWVDLFGTDIANAQVAHERRLKGRYDYDAAWNWALSLTREQRKVKFRALKSISAD